MMRLSLLRVLAAAALLVWTLPAGATDGSTNGSQEFLQVSEELRVVVHGGREVMLEFLPNADDDYTTIARRFAGERAGELAAANGDRPVTADRRVALPLDLLAPTFRRLLLLTLFPEDRSVDGDWLHVARKGLLPTYDEGLWQIALWFTGDGAAFQEVMRANGLNSPELRKGQVVRVPAGMLDPAFRARLRSDDGMLEYGADDDGPFAAYRLRQGEALYSAVVVRFTGRTGSEDVSDIAQEITQRSGIRDARDIPVHFEVKIPLPLLEPEFLPENHPRRIEAEAQQAELELELARKPVTSGGLRRTLIIIDPGHGGRDLGTMNHGVWEHDYVYDVACRLRKKLETQTAAAVFVTLHDAETGCEPSNRDKLVANHQGTIQTHPPFLAKEQGEARIGVNLRWFLANSVYRKALKEGYDKDRIVFISLHADSRHPSLRGLMVYVPGASYREKTYGSTSKTYARYQEVREKPTIHFSRAERVRSEAVSREYADRVVESFEQHDLPVQPFQPVRDKVIRGRSRWVPAVIRGNEVPTKVLVEMLNLSNREDAALMATALARERLATALLESLYSHFGEPAHRIAAQGTSADATD